MANEKRSDRPIDDLTRMGNIALAAIPETPGLRAIVFLSMGTRGGIAVGGYEDDARAIADLIQHLRAMLRVNGQDLKVVMR